MRKDDEGSRVLFIVDAATNDPAILINNFDLQTTPARLITPPHPSASMSGRAGGLDWGCEAWVPAKIAVSPVSAEQCHGRLVCEMPEIRAQPFLPSVFAPTLSRTFHAGISQHSPCSYCNITAPSKISMTSFTLTAINTSVWGVVDPLKSCISVLFKSQPFSAVILPRNSTVRGGDDFLFVSSGA
ncbi:hypothetical protein CVT25_002055 [Psilocybe cyanescens]|uniref:Uncharacterized protein n=1 Tax=Psilocybe cyanescens TaxID=93625 RepID=A0A409X984_PSICY|nr:hypothetical protein CVT25_002055 [Psilocybe cyanescens]